MAKNPPANAGGARDAASIPGLGRSSGVRNGNPLQYSCLENFVDRRAWRAAVHSVVVSWVLLNTAHTEGKRGTVIHAYASAEIWKLLSAKTFRELTALNFLVMLRYSVPLTNHPP